MKATILSTVARIFLILGLISYPQVMLINPQSKKAKDVYIVDKVIEKNVDNLKIDVVIPEVKGLDSNLNEVIGEWTDNWIKDVESVLKDYGQYAGAEPSPYELVSYYKVVNNDSKILSLYIDYYQFTGGAHGITTRIAYSVDKSTGKILNIKDLFKDNYNYKNIIDEEIKKEISKDKDKYFDEGKVFKGIDDNVKFYISGDNLIIYYGTYELAPYVAGIIEFPISTTLFVNNYLYGKM